MSTSAAPAPPKPSSTSASKSGKKSGGASGSGSGTTKRQASTSSTSTSKETGTGTGTGATGATETHKLSLKGSAKMVAEFFDYSINTILFQRGIYPADDFTPVRKYGLNLLITSDDNVRRYIKKIMAQLTRWTVGGKVSSLVVVITDKDTGGDVERWQFNVERTVPPPPQGGAGGEKEREGGGGEAAAPAQEPSEQDTQTEIQALFRQITAAVTFLPVLEGNGGGWGFNVLVYVDGDTEEVPVEWGDSEAREISGGEKVKLRSWGTSSHRVETMVSYRLLE
ncbi:mitotic spindle checkpoint component mad2 [Peziza echinospora]|nr:mitotic spindle checkpoint component mad2 [Peziza echinospora]